MLIYTEWGYLYSHEELSTFLLLLQGCFVMKMQAPFSFLQNLYQLKVHLEIQNIRNFILPRNSNQFKPGVKYLWWFLLHQLEMLAAPTLCFDLLLQYSLPLPNTLPNPAIAKYDTTSDPSSQVQHLLKLTVKTGWNCRLLWFIFASSAAWGRQ